jgi:hypothetical protein
VLLDPTKAHPLSHSSIMHGFHSLVKTRCGLVLTSQCAVLETEHRCIDVMAERMSLCQLRGGEENELSSESYPRLDS